MRRLKATVNDVPPSATGRNQRQLKLVEEAFGSAPWDICVDYPLEFLLDVEGRQKPRII